MPTTEEIKASQKAAVRNGARVMLTGGREVQFYPRHLNHDGRASYVVVFKRPKIRGKGIKKTLVKLSPEAMAALVALYEQIGDQPADILALDDSVAPLTAKTLAEAEGKNGDE